MKRFVLGSFAVALLVLIPLIAASPAAVDLDRTNAVNLFQIPAAGTDHLYFTLWDTIEIPNVGTDTVELRGTYKVRRSEATSRNWQSAEIDIDVIDMDVTGTSDILGRVSVTVNGTNSGRVLASNSAKALKDCETDGKVQITLHSLGVTVFNKEGIPLSHRISHVPPIGQGGSSPDNIRVPLYDVNDPNGAPVAYLLKVNTQIGGYVG